MANWTFYDEYGSQYPSLINSTLTYLVFSEHSINGDQFTGVLDNTASGVATATLAKLCGMNTWNFTGTVTNSGGTLTINLSLTSTDQTSFVSGISSYLPIIGSSITPQSTLNIQCTTTSSATINDVPVVDKFDMVIYITIGNQAVTITSQVPVDGGFFNIQGEFTNVGVSLNDLSYLFGDSSSDTTWFPATELGPYYTSSTQLGLIALGLTVFMDLPSNTILISNTTVSIGISNLPIYLDRIYLNPLAVWITVTNPEYSSTSQVTWGIEGSVVVCNYERTGDPANPDFSLNGSLGLTDYSLTASLDNKQNVTVATMVKDVLGPDADFGIPTNLTVDLLELETSADMTTGQISNFAFGVGMSGGFGLFDSFDIESFELRFEYNS